MQPQDHDFILAQQLQFEEEQSLQQSTGESGVESESESEIVSYQDSELRLTTKVMYEAPQMGNKKLPYSGLLYVFEDYIVFIEKKTGIHGIGNKNREKIQLKL